MDDRWSVVSGDIQPGATRISYPGGGTTTHGTVTGVVGLAGADGTPALGVVLDRTSAHPLSPTWPDQPADRGLLRTGAGDHALLDVRQGAVTDGGPVVDVPRAEGPAVVVHVVDASARIAVGDTVEVLVDGPFRRSLSSAHSACHLSALALDAALAPLWTKPVDRLDSLGHPAFDELAIVSSRLHPYRSVDVYRLGKSLRKKGLDASRLAADLDAVRVAHEAHLRRWVADGVPLHVEAGDGTLSARRTWCCRLDDTDVEIACGGTHAESTAELAGIAATFALSEALDQLVVTTTVPPD